MNQEPIQREQRGAQASADWMFLTGMVVLTLASTLVLIFAFVWPEIRAWFAAHRAAPAQLVAACRQPVDVEHLHIVIRPRDGALAAECMYVGSRGTYYRSKSGMPEPRP